MSRVIKFRQWTGDRFRLWGFDVNSASFSSPVDIDAISEQFTGLLDKNGVSVFEGDIVRILYTDWPSQTAEKNGRYSMTLEEYKDSISNIGKIVFNNCSFGVQFNDDGCTDTLHAGTHGQIKVIGNIHQHPDLLTV